MFEHRTETGAIVAGLVAGVLALEYGKVLELLPGGERPLLRAGAGWKRGSSVVRRSARAPIHRRDGPYSRGSR